ncbi:MAG TPA: hypothetical protein VFL14_08195 [Xanthomonadales bacterium]|nr:hypothetical protein [Xanthomonadales bacterium]
MTGIVDRFDIREHRAGDIDPVLERHAFLYATEHGWGPRSRGSSPTLSMLAFVREQAEQVFGHGSYGQYWSRDLHDRRKP